jgi:hypothetical protein
VGENRVALFVSESTQNIPIEGAKGIGAHGTSADADQSIRAHHDAIDHPPPNAPVNTRFAFCASAALSNAR